MAVRFRVLGPLVAESNGEPVRLGGARHRAIVARLLIARGRVVPVSRLIDDLWADPPAGALGSVQTFVGELRKALEPGRPPRTPARLLVTAPPGYALRVGPDDVDAARLETAVATVAQLLAHGEPARTRDLLDDALALWRGPAYAEFAEEDWARAEAARLEELRSLAVARRTEAALALGGAAELVPDLEAQVAGDPLREDGWRLLALALYRSGRQGDALTALRRARRVLRAELGVDPGPLLRQLEADVLRQAPHLTVPAPPTPTGPHQTAAEPFVGRGRELAALEQAAADVATGARPRLVLLSGAAGVGKSTLARAAAAGLAAAGWTVAEGASPEVHSAPTAWPWEQMQARLTSAGYRAPQPEPHPDPAAARFSRHRAIATELGALSADGPVLLVFDDLHWADEETLTLVTALATDPDGGAVLIVGTHRTTENSPALTEALARLARTEPARLELTGLSGPQVAELVAVLTEGAATEDDARSIAERSAGNPFFVRELTRLWAAEGHEGLHAVPPGVRDIVWHRLARLPESARTHLRLASVLGDEVDLDVLIPLAGDEEAVLASVESALLAGFLIEDGDRLGFAHALVRETLYADVPQARRARWHAATADVLEELRPDDVAAVAAHLLRAGRQVPAARTARWTRAAALRAEERAALHEAARLWRETVTALDRSDPPDPRARLEAAMGLVRALAVTGDLAQARAQRAAAVTAAEALGDPLLTARVLGSFDVPAVWTANDDEALSARLVAAAERTLAALPQGAEAERARLLTTVAMERRADATPRGREAATEATAIARALGDPALLALALNGQFLQTFSRAGLAPERARIGGELVQVARSGGLVTFEVLGHLVLIQSHAALADLAAADRHAAAADALAERHDLPVVAVFTGWYAALCLAVHGDLDRAATAYRAAASGLTGTGMLGMDGLLGLALLCLAPDAPPLDLDAGPYTPWARPLALLAGGRPDDARAADVPDSPRDLLFEARTCLHARATVRLGNRARMERLYDELLPAAGELAGAGSGLVTLGPVAQHLGDLAAALGRTGPAQEHYTHALAVAERAEAPHWAAAARNRLATPPSPGR